MPGRGIGTARAADTVMQSAVTLAASLSISNFNPALVPPGLASGQQFLTLGAWLACIVASYAVPVRARIGSGTEVVALCAFYALACWSVLWANQSASSLMKASALAVTTFAAFRVAGSMSVEAIVACSSRAYVILCCASLAVIAAIPSIGVDQTWMHEGYWQGVFESKQALGATTAMLIILTFHRLTVGAVSLRYGLFLVALAGLINFMSGSRDALGLAALGCGALFASAHSPMITRALCFAPLALVVLACSVLGFLWTTGEPFIPVFGVKVDLTERVVIWAYALSHFGDAPIFGFGLDGFWSRPEVLDAFNRQHGWVLDNYHDGFLAVLMETGMTGMSLFGAASLLFGMKARWLATPGRMARADHRLMVVFVAILFFANLTETYFLRSTNGLATLTLVFMVLAGRRSDDTLRTTVRDGSARQRTRRIAGRAGIGAALLAAVTGASAPATAGNAHDSDPGFAAVSAMGAGVNVLGYDGIWDGHRDSPFYLSHFAMIRRAGFRNVRINLFGFRHIGDDGQLDATFLEALDTVVGAATAAGLIPILDEHDSGVCQADADTCEVKLKQFWAQISARYAERLPKLAFEVLNEPGGALTAARWGRLAAEVLSIIRASNPDRTVVVALLNGRDGPEFGTLPLPDRDHNIVVTIHYYRPLDFTHQGAPWSPTFAGKHGIPWGSPEDQSRLASDFDAYAAWSQAQSRPLLLGEFGVLEGAPQASRLAWDGAVARAATVRGWAWDYWQFDHDFALFDTAAQHWNSAILGAILPGTAQTR